MTFDFITLFFRSLSTFWQEKIMHVMLSCVDYNHISISSLYNWITSLIDTCMPNLILLDFKILIELYERKKYQAEIYPNMLQNKIKMDIIKTLKQTRSNSRSLPRSDTDVTICRNISHLLILIQWSSSKRGCCHEVLHRIQWSWC